MVADEEAIHSMKQLNIRTSFRPSEPLVATNEELNDEDQVRMLMKKVNSNHVPILLKSTCCIQ